MDQVLFIGDNVYTPAEIKSVGNTAAKVWDAVCLSYRIDEDEEVIKFSCVGHGEMFETSVDFVDLEKHRI